MPEEVTPEEKRAYREGVVDQKLSDHAMHFSVINGSIAKLASAVIEVEKTVSRVADQVQGLVLTMPAIQKLASETATSAETAERVAEALRQKVEGERTTWDRYRNTAAWALGMVIAVVTIANFTTRMIGYSVKDAPAQTVTVPDITPGYP